MTEQLPLQQGFAESGAVDSDERALASGAAQVAGIANHAAYRISTGVVEGINNKIKVIKRVACGFRDMAYFFLRVRAQFSAVPQ